MCNGGQSGLGVSEGKGSGTSSGSLLFPRGWVVSSLGLPCPLSGSPTSRGWLSSSISMSSSCLILTRALSGAARGAGLPDSCSSRLFFGGFWSSASESGLCGVGSMWVWPGGRTLGPPLGSKSGSSCAPSTSISRRILDLWWRQG